MAGKTKLIAKERFFYGGRTVEKDEEFDAETQDVALLTAAFRPMASTKGNDVEPLSTKDLQPATGQATAGRGAKATGAAKYNRRDMSAKD